MGGLTSQASLQDKIKYVDDKEIFGSQDGDANERDKLKEGEVEDNVRDSIAGEVGNVPSGDGTNQFAVVEAISEGIETGSPASIQSPSTPVPLLSTCNTPLFLSSRESSSAGSTCGVFEVDVGQKADE